MAENTSMKTVKNNVENANKFKWTDEPGTIRRPTEMSSAVLKHNDV